MTGPAMPCDTIVRQAARAAHRLRPARSGSWTAARWSASSTRRRSSASSWPRRSRERTPGMTAARDPARARTPRPPAEAGEPEPSPAAGGSWLAVIMAVWIVVWKLTEGNDTLTLPGREHTDLHQNAHRLPRHGAGQPGHQPDHAVTNSVADGSRASSMARADDRPCPTSRGRCPQIGWLGVVAAATWIGYAVANWRIAPRWSLAFRSFGVFGYWQDSMDLLIITFIAVAIAVADRDAAGGLIGTERPGQRGSSRSILDFMQTMPTFVYLAADRAVLRHRRVRRGGLAR